LNYAEYLRTIPSRGRDRKNEPRVTTALPEPPSYLASTAVTAWQEVKSRGWWLTSADRFLIEIATTLMGRYRADILTSGDVSLMIGLLGKVGFSPGERGRLNLP
jgi:hypothetical protein